MMPINSLGDLVRMFLPQRFTRDELAYRLKRTECVAFDLVRVLKVYIHAHAVGESVPSSVEADALNAIAEYERGRK